MSTLSIKESFSFGWRTFMQRPWLFVGAAAVLQGISWLSNAAVRVAPFGHPDFVAGVSPFPPFGLMATNAVVWLAALLAGMWIFIGFVRMTLAATSGDVAALSIRMLFAEVPRTLWFYILASLLMCLIIGAGFILLVIPAFIWGTMFYLYPYALLDKQLGPVESLKESRRLTKGSRWNLLWLIILATLLNIAGVLVFFVGSLVTIPVTFLALAFAYRALDHHDDIEPVSVSR